MIRKPTYEELEQRIRELEKKEEIENLLVTDEATRADMAVALERLKKEIAVREQAEKSLRESEEKYRRLVDF